MRRDLIRTLFSRMLASYMAVMLVILVVTGVTVSAILQGQAERNQRAELDREAADIASLVAAPVPEGALTLEERCFIISNYEGRLVHLIRPAGGSALFYAQPKWEGLGNRVYTDPELQQIYQAARAGNVHDLNLYQSEGFPILSASRIVTAQDGAECLVLVLDDASDIREINRIVSIRVMLAFLVGALIAVILVYATTNRVTRPFMETNEIVQRYSRGDYSARIPISNIKEATKLAVSFNNMADQLEDLEASRRSFVANVSHELRSPLTSMKGFLEAMQDGTIGPEDHEKYLNIVLSETRRMASMVNDLLDLTRIESGKTALRLEVFDINELIRRTLITFEARIYEKKMEMEVKFAQDQYFVEADNAQISQVLRNLIDNALKYSPDERRLRIATYAMNREVYVAIQDFGYGIPEENVPHVFDRFYKVEKAHTPSKQSGTGLGLSIVKRIIDQHGQTITLKSAKGKGSMFTFTLKRVPNPKRQIEGGKKNGSV